MNIHSSFFCNNSEPEMQIPIKGMDKLWHSYTMEYYSEIARKKLLMHTTCKNLCERGQTKKDIVYNSVYTKFYESKLVTETSFCLRIRKDDERRNYKVV